MPTYHIRIQSHLADRYSEWFDSLTITREPSGETLLAGELADQGALFGVLLKIRDLGLPLLGVAEVKDGRFLMIHPYTDSVAGRFFDAQQRATIEAAMARIIPTDDQRGAREAGTIEFLDRYLSGLDFIYAKPDGSGFEKLEGQRAEAWQQRIEILREKYVEGIMDLDRRSQTQFGADFVRLTAEQQDRILTDLEHPTDATETSAEPALQQTSAEIQLDFFPLLCLHTRQGFYADPIYGGNKNRVGWEVIGFPGPTSLAEVHTGRYSALPWFAEGHTQPLEETEDGV